MSYDPFSPEQRAALEAHSKLVEGIPKEIIGGTRMGEDGRIFCHRFGRYSDSHEFSVIIKGIRENMNTDTTNNALGITMESVAGMLTPPKNVRIEPPVEESRAQTVYNARQLEIADDMKRRGGDFCEGPRSPVQIEFASFTIVIGGKDEAELILSCKNGRFKVSGTWEKM